MHSPPNSQIFNPFEPGANQQSMFPAMCASPVCFQGGGRFPTTLEAKKTKLKSVLIKAQLRCSGAPGQARHMLLAARADPSA